jgi:hypothetical protein
MTELSRRLAQGPTQFVHSLDAPRDLLLLVELAEADLRGASFLDQRVLKPGLWGRWLPFADIAASIDPGARDDAQYIFHIGHVGSTLIARLLGEVPGILSLREPLLLRDLAAQIAMRGAVDAPWDPASLPDRTRLIRRLLARTTRADERAIVKATSFTSEIATELVTGEARAVLLFARPESYMTTILAGDNSRAELAAITLTRLPRLARRLDDMPYRSWSLSEGERVAIGWVTEMLSLQAAADALPPEAVLWVDFDAFLADPAGQLARIADHLGLGLSTGEADRLAGSPIMQRYSKAPEHGYSPALRGQLQRQAAQAHGQALQDGLRLIERMRQAHPAVARLPA